MRVTRITLILTAATLLCAVVIAQEGERDSRSAPDDPVEEIIIRSSIGDLRRQVWQAEEMVFARFNDINSDDLFDVHCEWRPRPGSRVVYRVCSSNSWRQEETNIARSVVQRGPPESAYRDVQRYMQRRLIREMRTLLAT